MRLEQLRPFLTPAVHDLAQRSGAKFISFEEWIKLEPVTSEHLRMVFVAGFYSPRFDIIVIQPQHAAPQGFTVDEVVLHELTHWTGGVKRLRRKTMVLACNPRLANKQLTKKNEQLAFIRVRATEELIAHAGFFELSIALGLDANYAEHAVNRYARQFPTGNKWQAAEKAMEAARYLLERANRPCALEEYMQSSMFMK